MVLTHSFVKFLQIILGLKKKTKKKKTQKTEGLRTLRSPTGVQTLVLMRESEYLNSGLLLSLTEKG